MKSEKKVLACVDRSRFADCVTDYAAWAAQRMAAPLELFHIIDRHPETASLADHSGTIGIDAQAHLLAALSSEDEARSKAAREQGRVFLNRLRERAVAAGMPTPDVRQRYGQLVEALTEQQRGVRLYVMGRRGQSAETTQRDLGRNIERLVCSLQKPILAVTDTFSEPKRVMIAFDGGIVTRKGVRMIAASPLFKGLPMHLLMSGSKRQDADKQLDWARQTLEAGGFDVSAAVIPGDAEIVIAGAVAEREIDVLIMGAYSHSPLRRLLMGSKTTELLRATRIPTLLLR